ncbi:MAG: prepilin-type N-terminal cleavage/methylation domain-containing protein [Planctomycetes bacterium]|nr:prepilin-type N-terminal cleavage/methylation domain-containing protein [Planctomycetota bacterium]
MTDTLARAVRRAQSGFTLAELLLASVLGAMLLSALAVSTFGFASALDHMEEEAGINSDADPVLRRLTKEVREAFWVEHPEPKRLVLADANGALTEYFVQDGGLWVERPNGDTGVIYNGFEDFTIESTTMQRKREGASVSADGIFYAASAAGSAIPLVSTGSSQALALGFVAPAVPADIPGEAAGEEQVLAVHVSAFDLPIAFVDATGNETVTFELYEGWAPGKARPYANALEVVTLAGDDLPVAQPNGSGGWLPPASLISISMSQALEPGVGYTLLCKVAGTNSIVLKAVASTAGMDEVSLLDSDSWSVQSAVVPFNVKGPWSKTSTEVRDVINMVTLTAYPQDRPLQQRSAAVLSQALTKDPWLGIVPGESAP